MRAQTPEAKGRPGDRRTQPTSRPAASSVFYQRFQALRQRVLNPRGGLIDKMKLLQARELQRLLSYKGDLVPLFLQGIPRSRTYDALHFEPRSPRSLSYGVGLQLWLGSRLQIQQRWREQQRTYPGVRQVAGKGVGLSAFWAQRPPLLYLNFVTSPGTGLVSLTCHQKLCSPRLLLRLGRLLDTRFQARMGAQK